MQADEPRQARRQGAEDGEGDHRQRGQQAGLRSSTGRGRRGRRASTGPTLTAAGRRLKASTTMPRPPRRTLRRIQPTSTSGRARGRGEWSERRRRRAARMRPCSRSPTGSGAPAWADGRRWRPPLGLGGGGSRVGRLPARDRAAERLPFGAGAGVGRRRRPRPGALRRPQRGQAARHATHRLRLPPRPAARRVGQRLAPGRRASSRRDWPRRSSPTVSPSDGARLADPHQRRGARRAGSDGPATTAELRERVPALSPRLEMSPGKTYGGSFPIAPRVLSTLAASGRIMRGQQRRRLAALAPPAGR